MTIWWQTRLPTTGSAAAKTTSGTSGAGTCSGMVAANTLHNRQTPDRQNQASHSTTERASDAKRCRRFSHTRATPCAHFGGRYRKTGLGVDDDRASWPSFLSSLSSSQVRASPARADATTRRWRARAGARERPRRQRAGWRTAGARAHLAAHAGLPPAGGIRGIHPGGCSAAPGTPHSSTHTPPARPSRRTMLVRAAAHKLKQIRPRGPEKKEARPPKSFGGLFTTTCLLKMRRFRKTQTGGKKGADEITSLSTSTGYKEGLPDQARASALRPPPTQ